MKTLIITLTAAATLVLIPGKSALAHGPYYYGGPRVSVGFGFGYPWYGRCYNLGLEPCTSFHNGGLAQAQENGTALKVGAGESVKATVFAGAFTGAEAPKRVSQKGVVER